jgi:putative endonuclease
VRDGDCLAFVEVRTRRGRAYGSPEESITPTKLARMATVAEHYVYEQGWAGDWRLDVVTVLAPRGREPAVEWYRNVSM